MSLSDPSFPDVPPTSAPPEAPPAAEAPMGAPALESPETPSPPPVAPDSPYVAPPAPLETPESPVAPPVEAVPEVPTDASGNPLVMPSEDRPDIVNPIRADNAGTVQNVGGFGRSWPHAPGAEPEGFYDPPPVPVVGEAPVADEEPSE